MNGMSKPEANMTIEAWLDMLKDYDAELIDKALNKFVRTSTSPFMPAIGSIIENAEEIKKQPKPFTGKVITMDRPERNLIEGE